MYLELLSYTNFTNLVANSTQLYYASNTSFTAVAYGVYPVPVVCSLPAMPETFLTDFPSNIEFDNIVL